MKYGIIAGLICSVYTLLLYYYNPRTLVEGYENLNWLFLLAAVFYSSFQHLQQQKYALTQQLLRVNFQTFAVGYLIKYGLILGLFYTDGNLLELVKEAQLQFYLSQRDPNTTDEIFQQQLSAFKTMQQNTPIFDLLGLLIHLLMGFVLSLLLAFVMKREELE